jgi:diacylglycerol kinase (ATP)
MQRLALLANPTAGLNAVEAVKKVVQNSRRRALEAAVHDLSRRFEVEYYAETSREAIEERAAQVVRDGVTTVVAAGGDGTVNAVVNGMIGSGRSLEGVRLGVLPTGTGNVVAFNMGIPREWRPACKVIRKGHTRRIDLGVARAGQGRKMETRHFLLMAGIGYDAKVIEDTSLRLKYVLRDFAYALKTLENVVRHQGTQITLKLDGHRTYADIAWLVMVGNAASYAWNIKITPHARLDDGLLDVCLMPFENKVISVQQALQILTGQHIDRGIAKYWQVQSLRVESSPNVPIQLDGDEWNSTPVELSLLPGALEVLVPENEPM